MSLFWRLNTATFGPHSCNLVWENDNGGNSLKYLNFNDMFFEKIESWGLERCQYAANQTALFLIVLECVVMRSETCFVGTNKNKWRQ